MRLFTAIDIPDAIKLRLSTLLDRLRPLAKLAWSSVENLHITTKFIGEWPEERLEQIRQALAAVPSPGSLEIVVRGLGWFPNDRNPRVLWAGIETGERLRTLALDTERSLAAVGVPVEDKDFHPHLTLARRRNPVPLDGLKKNLADVSLHDFGSFRAEAFCLYLSKAGRYVKLHEFPLT
jgi:2'-5' RNA ligase